MASLTFSPVNLELTDSWTTSILTAALMLRLSRIAMMAITISNSISVKPGRFPSDAVGKETDSRMGLAPWKRPVRRQHAPHRSWPSRLRTRRQLAGSEIRLVVLTGVRDEVGRGARPEVLLSGGQRKVGAR